MMSKHSMFANSNPGDGELGRVEALCPGVYQRAGGCYAVLHPVLGSGRQEGGLRDDWELRQESEIVIHGREHARQPAGVCPTESAHI